MTSKTIVVSALAALTTVTAFAKPHIVLVHGAFADGSSWSKVVAILQKDGYEVEAVQNDMRSLADDIEHVQQRIDAQHAPTILVGHSYGGAVISGAGAKAAGLVYLAAFALDADQTLGQLAQSSLPESAGKAIGPDSRGFLYFKNDLFASLFANGVNSAEAAVMAASQRPVNSAAFGEKLPGEPAWKSVPSWYVVCDDDKVIKPSAEAGFAKLIGAKKTFHVKGGHASMVSHPHEIAQVIEAAAKAVESK